MRKAIVVAIGISMAASTGQAATTVGLLDGHSSASTFELGANGTAADAGWTDLAGAKIVGGPSANGALVGQDPSGAFSAQFDTGVMASAASVYTVNYEIGFYSQQPSWAYPNASHEVILGTINAGIFSALAGYGTTGQFPYSGNLADGVYVPQGTFGFYKSQFSYFGPSAPGSLAVRLSFAPVGDSYAPNPQAFGFDNIVLTASPAVAAVPEPSTWAMIILGFGAIGAAQRRVGRRRCALAT